MSYARDVQTAVLAHWQLETSGTLYPIGTDAAQVAEYPAAYALRAMAGTPERLDFGQSNEQTEFPFVLAWKASDETEDGPEDDIEGLFQRILLDPTLGGICRDAWVSDWVFDGVRDAERVWATVTVTARRIQGDS